MGLNEAPHPHEASDFGFSTIWKDELIISSTKSTLAPRTISKETPSTTTFAPSLRLALQYFEHYLFRNEFYIVPLKNVIIAIQAFRQFKLVLETGTSTAIHAQS